MGAILVALVLALPFLRAPGAAADRAWCRSDPVITVDGILADVFAAAPPEAPLLVTGPNQIVISVPPGVEARLVASDLGFGRGEIVTFAEDHRLRATADGIELRIALYVPATDDAMPVRLEFAPRIVGLLAPASAEGTANTWVQLATVLE